MSYSSYPSYSPLCILPTLQLPIWPPVLLTYLRWKLCSNHGVTSETMKHSLAFCATTLLLLAVASHAPADIIAGPITNPANGHDYYLLSPNSWKTSQAEAESLGGTLAVINDAAEDSWVASTFGAFGGANYTLWIGLHRQGANNFAWVTGARTNFFHWGPNQPDNAGAIENAVAIWPPNSNVRGAWNDEAGTNLHPGVVELPGKADKIHLSSKARALIGNWYEGGRAERRCWIAGTETALFVIQNNRPAARAGLCADGSLFAANSRYASPAGMRGEITKDKILWSDGTWWSRKPAE